jgi:hypothetical protein
MVDVIRNERVKSAAAILNAVAVAVVTVGVLTPLAVRVYTQIQPPTDAGPYLVAMPYACMGAGVALHLLGLIVLGLMDVVE